MYLARHLVSLLSMAAFGSTEAWASDIQCATTRQPAERVICDHAILNNEYDDISAQQQALLSSGELSPNQLARWKQLRNACSDVHCIDTVFAQWNAIARSVETTSRAAVAPVIASDAAIAPAGPASEAIALPASQAEASLVRQGSAAGVALPKPVETQASSPTVASAPSSASESRSATGMSAGLMMALLVAVGFGALFRRRRRSGGSTGEPPSNVRGKDRP